MFAPAYVGRKRWAQPLRTLTVSVHVLLTLASRWGPFPATPCTLLPDLQCFRVTAPCGVTGLRWLASILRDPGTIDRHHHPTSRSTDRRSSPRRTHPKKRARSSWSDTAA